VFTNKPKENNKFLSITAVSVDHVLSKIELGIEHVLTEGRVFTA